MAAENRIGTQPLPRATTFAKPAPTKLADGLWLDRIQPGGRRGPNDEVLSDFPGGRVWTDMFHLGGANDDFILTVPDIRLPANQYWPLHWHDCWIAVVVLDGTCLIGDWWMGPGDVLITAVELEYGPLVIGPDGCQMFEIFAKLHLCGGGYAPEYRDHPTLAGGTHAFKPRSALNRRNEGRMCLPCDGVEGLVRGRLEPGARWDLGEANDPDRGVMAYTALAADERMSPHAYKDWHALFVMKGGIRVGDRDIEAGDVLIAEPNARLDAIEASSRGAELLEVARTAAGMERAR